MHGLFYLKRLLVVLGVTFVMGGCTQQPTPSEIPLNCPNLLADCVHGALAVKFNQTPSALKPFKIHVFIPQADEIVADFVMQDMAMGLNRYRFKQVAPAQFEATVILPVCIQGRADWVMHLEVKQADKTVSYIMPFKSQ